MKLYKKPINQKTNQPFSEQGSFLVETIIAISLVVVGLLGIFTLLTSSFGFNNEVKNRFIASYLAAEGIEIVKNIIDTNVARNLGGEDIVWDSGIRDGRYEIDYNGFTLMPATDNFLIFNDENGYLYQPEGLPTIFKRLINIEILAGLSAEPIIKVNSIISWRDRGRDYSINLEDQFYNWRQ